MALTSTLKEVTTSDNIVARPQSGGGFVSSLARLGTGLSTVAGNNQQQFERGRREKALNAAAQEEFDRLSEANQRLETVADVPANEQGTSGLNDFLAAGQSGISEVPEDIKREVHGLSKIKSAVNQGSMPTAAFDLNFEKSVDKLFRMFPEDKAAIAQYFQSRGMDHYMFREFKSAMAAQTNAETLRLTNENAVIKAAVDAGQVSASASREEQLRIGQTFLANVQRFKFEEEALNRAKTNLEIAEKERALRVAQASEGMATSLIQGAAPIADTLMANINVLVAEAATDADKQNVLLEQVPLMIQTLEQQRGAAMQRALGSNMNEESRKRLDESFTIRIQQIKDLFLGDASYLGVKKKAFEGMQTQLGITMTEALPLWSALSKLPGMANTLPLIFGGVPGAALDPKTLEALKKEVKGFSLAEPDGMYRLQRISQVLRGELNLKTMSLEEARDAIPMVHAAVISNGEAINQRKDLSRPTVEAYFNGTATLADALITLSRVSDLRSHTAAARMVGDVDTWSSLLLLSKNPQYAEQAQQTAIALRSAAQKALIDMKTGDWQKTFLGGPLKLGWNPTKGVVEVQIDEEGYRKYADTVTHETRGLALLAAGSETRVQGLGKPVPLTRQELLKKGNATLSTAAETMNHFMNAIVGASTADPTVPATATAKQIREAAFVGKPLENITKPEQDVESFRTRVGKVSESMTNTIVGTSGQQVENVAVSERRATYEPIAHKYADQYGVPRSVISFVAGQESNWNPGVGQTKIDNNGDGKPDSSARGMMQFTDATAREYGLLGDGFDYRNDPEKSLEAGARLLADRFRKTGSWEKALESYGVTDRRNFKTEKDYQAVLSRMRNALNG